MIDACDVDRPEVVAEVRAAFLAYEAALVAGDAAALEKAFWASPQTVRFGIADRQRGAAEIARWRRTQGPLPGRRLHETAVTTFGPDAAVTTTLFGYPGRDAGGRQSQTWVRFAEGWRIVAAHVSEVPAADG